MKQEPLFENKNGSLFSLKTGRAYDTHAVVRVDTRTLSVQMLASKEFAQQYSACAPGLLGVCVPWKTVALSDGAFNEEYLAALREFLKNTEAMELGAVIIPEPDGAALEPYTTAMVHTARRIKDCASVAGFAFPWEFAGNADAVASCIAALSVKHPGYVYFSPEHTGNVQLIPYQMR
jgi:hypothetical protein